MQNKVQEDDLRRMLEEGVKTTEGVHVAQLLEVEVLREGCQTESEGSEQSAVSLAVDGTPDTLAACYVDDEDKKLLSSNYSGPLTTVRLVVSEGKHRMVRRMLANAGHPVIELKRERHGKILLGDLPCGEFRELEEEEHDWVEDLINSMTTKKKKK